jgi:hypothetical protein
MTHLTGVVFVRPTPANIAALARELKSPKFKEYHIFFSNVVVANDLIQTIADADELGVVRQVQEFYADVIPIDRALFSLNSQRLVNATVGRPAAAILSVFLSLKTRPAQIRFTGSSPATRALAAEVSARLASDDIHDFPLDADSPVLIILDRKSDPVTPLLSQWTYQAMVHELLGLNNGRVLLPGVPDGEVTMSGRDDKFFNENKYQNFGAFRCQGDCSSSASMCSFRALTVSPRALAVCCRRPRGCDSGLDAAVRFRAPRELEPQLDRRHAQLHGQVPCLSSPNLEGLQARDHHLGAQPAGGGEVCGPCFGGASHAPDCFARVFWVLRLAISLRFRRWSRTLPAATTTRSSSGS